MEKNQILKTDIVKINDQSNTIVKMNKSPNNNPIIQNNIFIQNPINDNTITFNDKKIIKAPTIIVLEKYKIDDIIIVMKTIFNVRLLLKISASLINFL